MHSFYNFDRSGENSKEDFVTRTIKTLEDVREAAVEEGIDPDQADEALERAINRLMRRYK